jgi:hypothetical protein
MKLAKTKVSFSIRPAVFLAGGWAEPCLPCEAQRAKKGTSEHFLLKKKATPPGVAF